MTIYTPSEHKKPKFFRIRTLIYPKFQLMLIGVNACLMTGAFLFIFYETSQAFRHFRELGQSIQLYQDHPYFKLIQFQYNTLLSHLIVAFVAALIAISFATLFISHRMAGPIVRLRGYFREIEKSKVVSIPLKFREGDFFEDLPACVNEALQALTSESKKINQDSTQSS